MAKKHEAEQVEVKVEAPTLSTFLSPNPDQKAPTVSQSTHVIVWSGKVGAFTYRLRIVDPDQFHLERFFLERLISHPGEMEMWQLEWSR